MIVGMTPQILLAGPILRRAEPARVCVWIATSTPVRARAEVFQIAPDREPALLGGGTASPVQLGRHLYVHVIQARPDSASYPTDTLLGYDLLLEARDGTGQRLADLGLLDGPRGLTYRQLPLPTFFIRDAIPSLHLLHGSCRLLHGKGEDAIAGADELLDRDGLDQFERPAALLLTGDQVYGDDVASALLPHVRSLASELCGEHDESSVPETPPLRTVPINGRRHLAEQAGFTADLARNHLLSFGEYAAMYLMAWDENNWPATFPPAQQVLADATVVAKRRYDGEVRALEGTRAQLPSMRRVLANCPTYMIFDDHDVTDDWNLTALWRDQVYTSPTGRRVVANALAAYWAFQGWGNDPDLYDTEFIETISRHLRGETSDNGAAFESALWGFDRWSYVAPTDPPTVMMDTRTQRSFDSREGAARLIGETERARIVELCRRAGHEPGQPLILVSAVPVYGLELQERRQKFLAGRLGPYIIDFEEWHSNLAGLVDFMRLLIDDLRLQTCVLLSGDVHYGMNVEARFAMGRKVLSIAQLISSSLKHSGVWARVGLESIGSLASHGHHRLGWDRPPRTAARSRLVKAVASHAPNTDQWNSASPVFLSPHRARHLGITQPPDYRESRWYLLPTERRASVLVGANNIGKVSLRGNVVTHRLFSRDNGPTRTYTVTITLPETQSS